MKQGRGWAEQKKRELKEEGRSDGWVKGVQGARVVLGPPDEVVEG